MPYLSTFLFSSNTLYLAARDHWPPYTYAHPAWPRRKTLDWSILRLAESTKRYLTIFTKQSNPPLLTVFGRLQRWTDYLD